MLPQDTRHLIHRSHYRLGSLCQDPGDNQTTRRPSDHGKGTQSAVVWTCLPFIRSGENHLSYHSERGTKARQEVKVVGRQHQGMDRPGVRQVPEGSGKQRNMEETGCEVICGTPPTFAVEGEVKAKVAEGAVENGDFKKEDCVLGSLFVVGQLDSMQWAVCVLYLHQCCCKSLARVAAVRT